MRSRANSEWYASSHEPKQKEKKIGQKLSYPDTPEQDTLKTPKQRS